MTRRYFTLLLVALSGLGLVACQRTASLGGDSGPPSPDQGPVGRVPLGNPPGQPGSPASDISNPFEGDAEAVQDGKALFGQMNCVYCHGANGSGLMGPPLNGQGWRYGGAPAQIYNSIHNGRPQGMPAWGSALPPQEIWKLVAYIESLGGAAPPASPNAQKLATPTHSTTGPQPAGQAATDTAARDLARQNARGERQ